MTNLTTTMYIQSLMLLGKSVTDLQPGPYKPRESKNVTQIPWMSWKWHRCFLPRWPDIADPALGQNTDNDGGYRHSCSKLLPEEKAWGVPNPQRKQSAWNSLTTHKGCPEIANNLRRWRPICSLSEWYRHCETRGWQLDFGCPRHILYFSESRLFF